MGELNDVQPGIKEELLEGEKGCHVEEKWC